MTTDVKFNKRVYESWRDLFTDFRFMMRNRRHIRTVMKSVPISPAFKERLMLAVTAVNDCRYCSYVHTREALKRGIDREEIDQILSQSVERCPEEEAIAIIYAQHCAESNGDPAPDAIHMLEQTYGEEKAEAINLILRIIRIGNLSGNSWDFFLYRISFGR